MRLAVRLTLFISAAALAPLIALGISAAQLATAQAQRHITDLQARTVEGLALAIDTWLSQSVSLIEVQARVFDPLALDADKRQGYLQLLYGQTQAAQLVMLTDHTGTLLAAPVSLQTPSPRFPERDIITVEQVAAFQEHIRQQVSTDQPIIGAPYQPDGQTSYVLPVSLPVQGRQATVHVGLALQQLETWLRDNHTDGLEVGIADQNGALFLASGDRLLQPEHFRTFFGHNVATSEVTYITPEGTEVVASSVAIPQTGWTVIAAAPVSLIAQSQQSVQARTAYIATVLTLVSLVWGVYFARALVRPIVALKRAALSVADGNLGDPVPEVRSVDEIADLSRAFNHMSRSLALNASEIAQKNAEIERFNQELQARVEERTQQLRAAQAQLVRTERLAAVGELSAGVAHELNNPMAAVLGLTQLLRQQTPDDPMLHSLEEQAQRCREILSHINQLNQRSSQPESFNQIELGDMLHGVLTLVQPQLAQRGVQVQVAALPAMHTVGDRAALARALGTTLLGLRGLFAGDGGIIEIHAHQADGQVGMRLVPVGSSPVGGDDWMANGLGLWVARQILSQHQGGLQPIVRNEQAAFVFWLPETHHHA